MIYTHIKNLSTDEALLRGFTGEHGRARITAFAPIHTQTHNPHAQQPTHTNLRGSGIGLREGTEGPSKSSRRHLTALNIRSLTKLHVQPLVPANHISDGELPRPQGISSRDTYARHRDYDLHHGTVRVHTRHPSSHLQCSVPNTT